MKPAAERGGIRHSMGILYRRGRPFPTTSVYKISPERFTAGDQAVMGIRKRKRRQESNRFAARAAEAAANRNPVMVLVMRLLAPTAMADY
jgi:hypothetical protein